MSDASAGSVKAKRRRKGTGNITTLRDGRLRPSVLAGNKQRVYFDPVATEAEAEAVLVHARQDPALQNLKSSWVYFVQSEDGGPIKIGRASDIEARLSGLRTSRTDTLVLLASQRGGAREEGRLHRRFKHLRTVREWFQPGPELLAHIASIALRAAKRPLDKAAVKESVRALRLMADQLERLAASQECDTENEREEVAP